MAGLPVTRKLSVWKFGTKYVHLLDLWCFGEKVGSIGHKRGGDRAGEMRGLSCLVGKCIENAKRGPSCSANQMGVAAS